MRKLTYKKVFSKYEKSFSHILARKSYAIYKAIRIGISKWFPLKEYEKYHFQEDYSFGQECAVMPKGFDRKIHSEVDGKIELKYVDFYDYLPKEDIDGFKRRLRKFVLNNKRPMFSSFRTAEDDKRITNMGRYVDGLAFAKLHTVEFSHNSFLKANAPQVAVSIHNLSASFSLIKFRFYISDQFNNQLNDIFNAEYHPYSDVSRQYNVPWYKPWKFGYAMYTGDNGRTNALYILVSELKWIAFKEIKKYFRVYFGQDKMFPPSFETYSTNILPSDDRKHKDFWDSIGLEYNSDYSTEYNACVSWSRQTEENMGMILRAFCGGNYSEKDSLPEIAEHDMSDMYGVYMAANTIRLIAERDIAAWNKKISKAVRKKKSLKLLSVRSEVDRKTYYSYRFMSEFTGETLESVDSTRFRNPLFNEGSITERSFNGIAAWISETKQQVDNLLNLLNNAADFQSSKSNMRMQWFMMTITVLSLVVAIIALTGIKIDLLTIWNVVKAAFGKIF